MDANRLIRWTAAGWLLLIAWGAQAWALGRNVRQVLEPASTASAVAAILIGVVASPLIGFILSSATEFALRFRRGGDAQFDPPATHWEARAMVNQLICLLPACAKELQAIGASICSRAWAEQRTAKTAFNPIMPFLNVAYHSRAATSLIDYTTRRWTLYWMHANSICAIIVGSLVAIGSEWGFWGRPSDWLRVLVEVPTVWFVAYSYVRLGQLRRDVRKTVAVWLCNEADGLCSRESQRFE